LHLVGILFPHITVDLTDKQRNFKTKSAYTDEKLARSKICVRISSTDNDRKEYFCFLKDVSSDSRFIEALSLFFIYTCEQSVPATNEAEGAVTYICYD